MRVASWPDGQSGDCNDHVCTICLGASSEMYLPLTPPPNSEYSDPGVGLDYKNTLGSHAYAQEISLAWAGPRVQIGIRFSSVKRLNKSSAAAINVASTSTVDVFTVVVLGGALFVAGLGAGAAVVTEVALMDCTGVPVRLGSALTVRSFPCVSIIAAGNSANLVSRAMGNLFFASWYRASTGLDDFVESVQLYFVVNRIVRRTVLNCKRASRKSYHVFRKPVECDFMRDFRDD